jgi:putative ABC transport system ATP-binding protein
VTSILEIRDLRFGWPGSEPLLSIPQLDLARGESIVIRGPSGCGKTTLLSLIAGVLVPQSGSIQLLGQELSRLSSSARDRLRGEHMGVIFQQFNLLPYLTVLQNVVLPAQLFSSRSENIRQHPGSLTQEAERLLGALGLDSALWGRPAHQLSVGQQQRVAAARALLGSPELIIADEPTSALDEDLQQEFMQLLMQQVHVTKAACIMVTHQRSHGAFVDRVIEFSSLNAGGAKAPR